MITQVLVIGAAESKVIARVIRYAEANPLNLSLLRLIKNDLEEAARQLGDVSGCNVDLPVGWHVAFSIEEQEPPLAWCRHVSATCNGQLPTPSLMEEIAGHFGFVLPLRERLIYLSRYHEGVVNQVEPLDRAAERMAFFRERGFGHWFQPQEENQ